MVCWGEGSESKGDMIAFGTSVNKESCGVTTAEWGGVFLSGVILSLTLGNTY